MNRSGTEILATWFAHVVCSALGLLVSCVLRVGRRGWSKYLVDLRRELRGCVVQNKDGPLFFSSLESRDRGDGIEITKEVAEQRYPA